MITRPTTHCSQLRTDNTSSDLQKFMWGYVRERCQMENVAVAQRTLLCASRSLELVDWLAGSATTPLRFRHHECTDQEFSRNNVDALDSRFAARDVLNVR